MRGPRRPRHFTDEFKRRIVDLYNAGKPKREIMYECDLGKSTVERWVKSINAIDSPRARAEPGRAPGPRARPSCSNCSILRAPGVQFPAITRTAS